MQPCGIPLRILLLFGIMHRNLFTIEITRTICVFVSQRVERKKWKCWRELQCIAHFNSQRQYSKPKGERRMPPQNITRRVYYV